MIRQDVIREMVDRLVDVYNPLEIYLFGSYAWGNPDAESDVDFLIVVENSDQKRYKRPLIGYEVLHDMHVPNDLMVYTKEEFDERAHNVTTLVYKIKTEGQQIYARA